MKTPTQEDITGKLLAGNFGHRLEVNQVADPIVDTPMLVTLEQLRPYEHNPRFLRNPLYDDLKASIRERGLDQPPPITRRPGEASFIIRNGGNTRLAILGELWQETRDERFFRIHCLFKPWTHEISALLGHLAESDLHGQLTFIERALAVAKLKAMFEQDGPSLPQRELATRLAAGGYPISQAHLSRMLGTLEHLLPAIPQVLYAGLGKPQVERLISLRNQAELTWNRYPSTAYAFNEFWLDTLASFDTEPEGFDVERVQDELLERMSPLLGQSYRMLALELTASQRPQPQPGIVVSPLPELAHPPSPTESAPAAVETRSAPSDAQHPASEVSVEPSTQMDEQSAATSSALSRVQQIRELIARETMSESLSVVEGPAIVSTLTQADGCNSLDGLWPIEPAHDTPEQLRSAIFNLAKSLASYAGQTDSVVEQNDGLGYVVRMEPLGLSSPRATGIQLLLTALLRAHDEVQWEDRQQLPAALFGQLLLGVYQVPLHERPALNTGLERLPDAQLLQLFRLIRLTRRLIEQTLEPSLVPPEALS
ncbi:ParB family protein [Pseudomonas silesiensis]|uniref:ParB family protein n=1 Tax=Pseudomonas silesiensis TaxID=1853130 RepID=UPI0030D03058